MTASGSVDDERSVQPARSGAFKSQQENTMQQPHTEETIDAPGAERDRQANDPAS